MGASLLNCELKRAIGNSGGSGIGAARRKEEPPAERIRLLSLEIATALGFNARHV
ncbi:hypothetical protein MEA186_10574 [Mesorhizobium amorphae CCNWGS0123]|uniref:Uncharacterized protein n=2 Tax=Phyllobacteriaceae TaxID=69277 RepID=G6Y848_9HYPH|nr:hypothetical protein MEA186_10574 [Mesorhizobium amorphae CCNWGS0123]